jgi:hypothetical protein
VNALRALLADRRRSQRGSVLSGVLIITAFLAILSGALMTELSTNFLLSNALVNRVSTEATVNSAMELALDQLQHAPLSQSCPTLTPASLPNQGTAVASYVSCALVVDSRSAQFRQTPLSSPLNVDGTHVVLPAQGRNDYLAGDASGNVFDYRFDNMSQRWSKSLGGSVTGPPLQMADVSNQPQGVIDLIPLSSPTPGASPGCGPSNFCVASIAGGGGDDDSNDQSLRCFMAASAIVSARPAAGISNPDLTYFGDGNGTLFAYDTDEGTCAQASSPLDLGTQAVVAGPVVFSGSGGTDHLYVVVSDGVSSFLVHSTYTSSQGLRFVSSLALPAPQALGMALEPGTLPSRLAITFAGAGGQVALAQIQARFGVSLLTSTSVPTTIAGAPYWCQCPGGDLIGVGGRNGALYLLDTSLNTNATFPPGGAAISTSPAADAAGDWFFGADDGNVYQVQRQTGQATLVLATAQPYGSGGSVITSSPTLGSCNTTWICVYAGSADSLYLVPLDARHAVVTACMATSPPACSGSNPQLWASVEVGSASSLNTVHVKGWSYYSP